MNPGNELGGFDGNMLDGNFDDGMEPEYGVAQNNYGDENFGGEGLNLGEGNDLGEFFGGED